MSFLSRRTLLILIGVVVIAVAALVAVMALRGDSAPPLPEPETTTTTTTIDELNGSETPATLPPQPSAEVIGEVLAWQEEMATKGADGSYAIEVDYSITYEPSVTPSPDAPRTKPEAIVRSGTASFARAGDYARVSVRPESASELTVWSQPSTGALIWCDDASCYSTVQTQPRGDLSLGSPFQQAAYLLTNLDPGAIAASIPAGADEQPRITKRQAEVLGTTVECTRLEVPDVDGYTYIDRCWSKDGQVVLLESPFQRIAATSTSRVGDITPPHPVVKAPSAPIS